MPLTKEQQDFLSRAYNTHLEGKSKVAAELVKKELEKTAAEELEYRAELSRQVVVISNAASRQEVLEKAVPLLRDAVTTILNEYPVGSDKAEVEKRNTQWEQAFGEQNAQVACLRDVLHVAENVYGITRKPELLALTAKMKEVLFAYYSQEPEGFAVIQFVCEEGTWEEAKNAYAGAQQFAEKDTKGFIITTARMLGRALDEHDWDIALDLFSKIIGAAKSDPKQQAMLVVTQIGKNFSSLGKKEKMEQKRAEWRAAFEGNPSAVDVSSFELLENIAYVGLGQKQGVVEVQ